METFAPEFAQYWHAGQSASAGETKTNRDDDATAQQAALEALAERVTLARSVF